MQREGSVADPLQSGRQADIFQFQVLECVVTNLFEPSVKHYCLEFIAVFKGLLSDYAHRSGQPDLLDMVIVCKCPVCDFFHPVGNRVLRLQDPSGMPDQFASVFGEQNIIGRRILGIFRRHFNLRELRVPGSNPVVDLFDRFRNHQAGKLDSLADLFASVPDRGHRQSSERSGNLQFHIAFSLSLYTPELSARLIYAPCENS